MSTSQRTLIALLALALLGGLVWAVFLREGSGPAQKADDRSQPAERPSQGPDGWDLAQVPDVGAPVRSEAGEGGLIIQILEEGEGKPLSAGMPYDLHYRVFTLDGRKRDQGVMKAFVLQAKRGGLIKGFSAGLESIRMLERRRILVPSDLGYGARPPRGMPADAGLVFDVQPVRLVTEDLVEGTGAEAKLNGRVTVHYEGTLEDGTVFDSSYKRGEPITFGLVPRQLIDGWIQGIPGMKVGGKRRLWIPWHLAYGRRSTGKIPAYSNLVFVVELVAVPGS